MSPIVKAANGVSFMDGADRARILVFGRDTGGKYSLMEWIVGAGEKLAAGAPRNYGPHLHREIEETFLVRKGTLEFLLGDTVTTLTQGDFVRVPPGTRHGYANVSGEDVELLVSFHPGGLEELFLKYRTDGDGRIEGGGFVADATKHFASEYEA